MINLLKSNAFMIFLHIFLVGMLYQFGGIGMVVWGVLLRVVWVWHITWLINSATHKWGYRWFNTKDNSTNNWLTALFAFGEGWHNTHHSHESSPRHGLAWWEIDITWYHIWVLQKVGLAWNLKSIPKPDDAAFFATPRPNLPNPPPRPPAPPHKPSPPHPIEHPHPT